MTDCLKKLSEIFNKIDVSNLSIEELAKKLGMEVEEFLLKIANEFDELKDALSEPNLGKISEKFKDLIGQNIIFKTLSTAVDILDEAGGIITNAGDFLEDKISSAISGLKSISVEDIITAPFKLAGGILSEINDQINKNICNGNLLENLAGILGDIDGAIAGILGALSPTDLKKLLETSGFGKVLTNLLKGAIIVDALTNNLKKKQNDQRYIAPPTNLTVNNDAVPTSVTTTLSALSGTVVDESLEKPINTHYTLGGPWDFNLAKAETIYKFSINKPFLIKQADIGDFIFNIGITGDVGYSLNGKFYESEITFVYGINRRLNVSNEECEEFTTTKMVLINSISFSGLGNTLADSRYNAFLECRSNTVNDIISNKQSLIDIFKENT